MQTASSFKMEFITDEQIYHQVIQSAIPEAAHFVWMATADLKDLHVGRGRRMIPFLEVLAELADRGVALRLLHAKEPGPLFRRDFDRFPQLLSGLERFLCPRIHFKSVIVDGTLAYAGSANLTGAGMGAKSIRRRNFESGFLTTDPQFIRPIMDQFDQVWMGAHCASCGRKSFCADNVELDDTTQGKGNP